MALGFARTRTVPFQLTLPAVDTDIPTAGLFKCRWKDLQVSDSERSCSENGHRSAGQEIKTR